MNGVALLSESERPHEPLRPSWLAEAYVYPSIHILANNKNDWAILSSF
jgi:hypothetical protein